MGDENLKAKQIVRILYHSEKQNTSIYVFQKSIFRNPDQLSRKK